MGYLQRSIFNYGVVSWDELKSEMNGMSLTERTINQNSSWIFVTDPSYGPNHFCDIGVWYCNSSLMTNNHFEPRSSDHKNPSHTTQSLKLIFRI